MKLRSYHTDTVEAAIRMAGIELGDEAIFLGSKKAADKGPYEVTFAVVEDEPKRASSPRDDLARAERRTPPSPPQEVVETPGEAGSNSDAEPVEMQHPRLASAPADVGPVHWRKFVPVLANPEAPRKDADSHVPDSSGGTAKPNQQTSPPRITPGANPVRVPPDDEPLPASVRRASSDQERLKREERLAALMADLTRSLADVRDWLRRQQGLNETLLLPSDESLDDPLRATVYTRLIQQGVEPRLVLELLRGVSSRGGQRSRLDEAETMLQERLGFLCEKDDALGDRRTGVDIVALVGPGGVGKTATLAKLAIRYGLSRGVKVHFVGVDPLRVGIAEPLEAYARLLDASLAQATESEALRGVVRRIADTCGTGPALILIDTPGYAAAEWPSAQRLARSLLETPGIDTHLAVSLTTKPHDLRRTIERYQIFRPGRLLFTHLDETETHGSAVNEAARTKLPLSFFTNGPTVPEDLAGVTPSLLARLLLGRDGIGAS
jgi:flagellar biosynthesis GTPase FlhF